MAILTKAGTKNVFGNVEDLQEGILAQGISASAGFVVVTSNPPRDYHSFQIFPEIGQLPYSRSAESFPIWVKTIAQSIALPKRLLGARKPLSATTGTAFETTYPHTLSWRNDCCLLEWRCAHDLD
jgi:hypothetical protein